MSLLREILFLIQKEVLIEWRNRYAISGILLYVLSTVFIVYISFIQVQAPVWNILFWIIVLFASVNAITKSFVRENSNRQLYYFTLMNPLAVLFAKMLYNAGLLLLLSLLTWLIFGLITINPVTDYGLFFLAIFLASFGLSVVFTFVSAISAKADNNATLLAILSFPLVIPILMTILKISASALRLMQDTGIWKDISILLAINLMLVALGMILFPYLWRD